jgi:hypothetical protein
VGAPLPNGIGRSGDAAKGPKSVNVLLAVYIVRLCVDQGMFGHEMVSLAII